MYLSAHFRTFLMNESNLTMSKPLVWLSYWYNSYYRAVLEALLIDLRLSNWLLYEYQIIESHVIGAQTVTTEFSGQRFKILLWNQYSTDRLKENPCF